MPSVTADAQTRAHITQREMVDLDTVSSLVEALPTIGEPLNRT